MNIPQTSGTCPHCRKKISDYAANKYRYGSPIRVCPKCGGAYLDTTFHEVVTDGFPPDELSMKKGVKSALIGAAIFVVCAAIFVLELFFSDRIHIYPPILAVMGIVTIVVSIVDIIKVKSGAKAKELEIFRLQSVERLRSPAYARQLAELGYNVPKEFLDTADEPQSAAEP
ncbi:MAG: zf-TFIIB domain-containing protein [Bacteroides sp.]|nr:zf-TFIIB domain-containing protein [Bacteroides sp.]